MRPFRDIPIKSKLMLIITGTSALVLFLACAAFFIFELVTYRARMVRSLEFRADVLGSSCLAPLIFDDPKAARQTLKALSRDPRIRLAGVYSKEVRPFASYAREGEKAGFPSWPGADGSRFTPSRLVLVRGIFDGETRAGTLYLVEDLDELYRGLGFFLAIAAGVLLVFSGTAFWLSGMFQRLVSNALLELTRTAKTVSATADYSVRVVKRGQDEVGDLVDGFNEMLCRIQTLNAGLEERVRQRTAELSVSETRYRAVTESAVDAIISADARGAIVSWNKGAERMFERPASEAIGQPLTIIVPPRFRERHLAGIGRFVATGEARLVGKGPVELVSRRRDGAEFPVDLSLSSWKVGGDVFFSAIIRDASVRKKNEKALESYASQLQAANKELESFSYSVAHDLRAPLRGIDGFSSILAENLADKLDARGQHMLSRIRAATRHMSEIIDDMLNLSRVTRSEMCGESVDLSRLAGSVAADLERRDPERKMTFKIAEDVRAWGDSHLLRILLENLIGNAWKFTSKIPDGVIEFGSIQQDGRQVYFVRDNGAGFDPAFADKLFKPFVRLHTGEEFPGTGIGLSIVSRIVERHGGRAWASGEVGKGATFFFALDLRRGT